MSPTWSKWPIASAACVPMSTSRSIAHRRNCPGSSRAGRDLAGLRARLGGGVEHEGRREVGALEAGLVGADLGVDALGGLVARALGAVAAGFDARADFDLEAALWMDDQRARELDVPNGERERKLVAAGDVCDRFGHCFDCARFDEHRRAHS